MKETFSSTITHILRALSTKRVLLVVLICTPIFLLTNTFAFFFFGYLGQWLGIPHAEMTWAKWFMVAFGLPAGMTFVSTLALTIEALTIGWELSAFKRLSRPTNQSTKTDLFYFAMSLSGLRPLCAFVLSFGLSYLIERQSSVFFGFNILGGLIFPAQFLIVVLVNSFFFYLVHRTMHTRFLWEIHRTHHSAHEMNVLTPYRNHPVDLIVVTIIHSVPAAVLGASPGAIALYNFINGLYQSLVHSNITVGRPFIDSYFLITPEAHRIHHSNNPKHWDKNFGILTFWDKLFGTHHMPDGQDVEFGFSEQDLHNTGRPIREIFKVLPVWLRQFPAHFAALRGANTKRPAKPEATTD